MQLKEQCYPVTPENAHTPFTVANIFWDKATREGSVATISSLAFLTPLVSITLLATFGLSVVTMATVLGALLAIAGAVLSSRY